MNVFARHLLDEYNALLSSLADQELLIDANPLDIGEFDFQDKDSGERLRKTSASWSGASGLAYLMDDHASIRQYSEIVKRRDFNFCLYDGSLIQLHYEFTKEGVIKHRLCFVPCPFTYPTEEQAGLGLAEIPELMSESEMRDEIRLRSPIRFDFDAKFCDDKHAHSHVTLNNSSCRIPAYGPVSLGHFVRFVFRYFYEEVFDNSIWWRDIAPRIYIKTLASPYPHEFHLQSSASA